MLASAATLLNGSNWVENNRSATMSIVRGKQF
jgi:hypothetical protein